MSGENELECPVCDGPMVQRTNKETDEVFFGCVDFPKCLGTRDSQGRAPKRSAVAVQEDEEDGLPSSQFSKNDRQRWRRE